MNRSTPGLPVHHQLPEFTQTHVHWVSDAIQPSHLLSSPSPPATNPSQHQSLFQWVNTSHEVAKVLEFQLQHHSLQRNPRLLRLYLDLRARRALIICHILIFYYSKRTVPSCLQSSPASGSFLMSHFFASGGQSIGASTSASVLPMNIQDWFPLGLTGLISLQSKGLSRVFSNTKVQKHQFFSIQPSLWSRSHIYTHDYWRNHSFD